MSATTRHSMNQPALNRDGIRRLVVVMVSVIGYAFVFSLAAGTLQHWGIWLYVILSLLTMTFGGWLVVRRNPEVINNRGRSHEGTKGWDSRLLRFYTLAMLAIPVAGGLDARFGWTPPVPALLLVVGVLLLVAGSALTYGAMLANPHFEPTVRIQGDRDHRVISTGPYRWVRHPGYVGFMLGVLALPLVVGEWAMYAPVLIAIALMVLRTVREDRTLHEELPGYADYARRTPYRLIPGIW